MTTSASWSLQQTRSLQITRSLGQAIALLKLSNRELAAYLCFQAAVNPHVALHPANDPPGRGAARGPATASGRADPAAVDRIANPSASLHEHARREIGLLSISPRERSIAEHFVNALEPTGWLGRPVADIARDAGCTPEEAEATLGKIQRVDPPGLFARSLSECLRLQAEEAGRLTRELSCLLDNLPMLARGDFDALARTCGCQRRDIEAHFAIIRGFDPKPGLSIGAEAVQAPAPDLVVTLGEDGLSVELNRSTLPGITVRDATGLSAADQQMLDAARAVARAVERRNISTIEIASEVMRRQSGFFRDGPSSIRPLTLREVAEATGVHESTVSRIACGLRMDTPRGPMALRDFFSGALPTGGDPISTYAVRARIRTMIAAEDPSRPLTDAEIADRLSEEGIRIARRTVAKYRGALRVPGTAARRRGADKRHP